MRIEYKLYFDYLLRRKTVAIATSKFEKEILYHLKYRWATDDGIVSFSDEEKHLIDFDGANTFFSKKFRWLADAMYYLYADCGGILYTPSDELVLGVAKYCHSRKNKILRLAAWNRRHHDTIISFDSYKLLIERGGFNVYYDHETDYDNYDRYKKLIESGSVYKLRLKWKGFYTTISFDKYVDEEDDYDYNDYYDDYNVE